MVAPAAIMTMSQKFSCASGQTYFRFRSSTRMRTSLAIFWSVRREVGEVWLVGVEGDAKWIGCTGGFLAQSEDAGGLIREVLGRSSAEDTPLFAFLDHSWRRAFHSRYRAAMAIF